jgi:aryl-alcohol dehydrogenase-like predicted oxidoreductase
MDYKLFGRTGLRVSELCLGTMTFGTEWGWGADYGESQEIFDAFAEKGGNFVDTANRYTEGTSERWLGEFIKSNRHHFVLATKYTLRDQTGDPNFAGSHRKNMMRSVEASLQRLDTEFIDVFWVHAWDHLTPTEEVLRGLDDLVRSGKVLYVGVSDTPAWMVSKSIVLAELRGWTAFAGLQVEYSLIQRTVERELFPMAQHFGMAVTPWGALGGGALTGKYLKGESGRLVAHSARRSDRANEIAQKVVDIADKRGVPAAQVAINWTRQQNQGLNVIPLIGARTAEQLESTLGCLDFQLDAEEMQILDAASAIDLGFPQTFLETDNVRELIYGGTYDRIKP